MDFSYHVISIWSMNNIIIDLALIEKEGIEIKKLLN
jgi:hypothetical protein